MPVFEFTCEDCLASRDVLAGVDERGVELICVHCGGVMRASQVSGFTVLSSSRRGRNPDQSPAKGHKACGHTHACRCAVKMTRSNPFQDQVDAALHHHEPE